MAKGEYKVDVGRLFKLELFSGIKFNLDCDDVVSCNFV